MVWTIVGLEPERSLGRKGPDVLSNKMGSSALTSSSKKRRQLKIQSSMDIRTLTL
jgi:hypothetical protein